MLAKVCEQLRANPRNTRGCVRPRAKPVGAPNDKAGNVATRSEPSRQLSADRSSPCERGRSIKPQFRPTTPSENHPAACLTTARPLRIRDASPLKGRSSRGPARGRTGRRAGSDRGECHKRRCSAVYRKRACGGSENRERSHVHASPPWVSPAGAQRHRASPSPPIEQASSAGPPLPRSVTVAQEILVLFVLVRIQAG